MGLVRDALGSALGAKEVKNGFNGPKLPFMGGGRTPPPSAGPSPSPQRRTHNWDSPEQSYGRQTGSFHNEHEYYTESISSRGGDVHRFPPSSMDFYAAPRQAQQTYENDDFDPPPLYTPQSSQPSSSQTGYPRESDWLYPRADAPSFESSHQERPKGHVQGRRYLDSSHYEQASAGSSRTSGFRILALPQIGYAKGDPFLRAYSDDLRSYGISEQHFFDALDAINVARVPNPEMEILQKGARIAGFFVPGAATIGLIGGQVGLGITAAMGHASMIARVLSKVNLEIFIPSGLEICIGKAKDVHDEIGIPPPQSQTRPTDGTSAEDQVAFYGDLVAPLTIILPPAQNKGRQDPVAFVGRRINDRGTSRKVRRAQSHERKGETDKMDALQDGSEWLMVRRATPGAVEHWQRALQRSDEELRQQQAAAESSQDRG